jgi:hypothetical protein
MLNVANALGGGAAAALDARVAVGAGVFTVGSAPEPESQAVAATQPKQTAYNYNAFEFSYRADYGKIILLQQNVETGAEVTQVPTEYHLRQYAATQREQRVQLQQKLYKVSPGAEPQSAPKSAVVAKTSAAPSETTAPPASQPAAPTVSPTTVAAAAVAHVDIKA